jgi:hypothetical protein
VCTGYQVIYTSCRGVTGFLPLNIACWMQVVDPWKVWMFCPFPGAHFMKLDVICCFQCYPNEYWFLVWIFGINVFNICIWCPRVAPRNWIYVANISHLLGSVCLCTCSRSFVCGKQSHCSKLLADWEDAPKLIRVMKAVKLHRNFICKYAKKMYP